MAFSDQIVHTDTIDKVGVVTEVFVGSSFFISSQTSMRPVWMNPLEEQEKQQYASQLLRHSIVV
ncbi:hypothetical protein [Paenibacillus sp. FSL H7-0331]|uniref:hypothetical protein n=1 Tax=Paenibacillus sp. FSL H7-0331 TaxID=1920421 RepID=UPI00096E631E|nr:hypothetical protein [Paenibacillus sp. FSL H7-0331]OMF00869.1 hypothetical protein BK127_37700 [Paenibacillus sp. FSL H7-0331]